jgi:hypothetical protein
MRVLHTQRHSGRPLLQWRWPLGPLGPGIVYRMYLRATIPFPPLFAISCRAKLPPPSAESNNSPRMNSINLGQWGMHLTYIASADVGPAAAVYAFASQRDLQAPSLYPGFALHLYTSL